MANISLLYLFQHAGYRILEFFRHWYAGGFFWFRSRFFNVLRRLDRVFAFRITLKNLFQPLYQDYTIIGYMWGFIFRSIRIVLGGLAYSVLISVFLVLYLIWAAAPVYIIYRIINN